MNSVLSFNLQVVSSMPALNVENPWSWERIDKKVQSLEDIVAMEISYTQKYVEDVCVFKTG